jgi:hypothetical protein
MRARTDVVEAETESTDHAALRLMLSYVEAECLRIGAIDAARHAALAASLMPEFGLPVKPEVVAPMAGPRGRRLRLH